MKKDTEATPRKKLSLNRETLRELTMSELTGVAGATTGNLPRTIIKCQQSNPCPCHGGTDTDPC